MSFGSSRLAQRFALTLTVVMLCRGMADNKNSTNTTQAQMLADEDQEFGLIGSRQVNLGPASGQFVGGPVQQPFGGMVPSRFRRQVAIPEGSPLSSQQPAQQSSPGGTNVFSFLSELGPQVAQAKSISSLFSSNPQQQPGQQQQPGNGGANQNNVSSALNAAALMGQLSEMIRSTQDRQSRMLESGQQAAQSVNQSTMSAAQNAQGGIQSALADIGAGLQRIAANNPNLLPDVKNLYQSVSSKLSSASSSVAQAANGPQSGQSQFAQGVANQIAQPQPLPTPSS